MSKQARDRKKIIRLSKHFMPDKEANPINPPWIVDKQGCKILRKQLFKFVNTPGAIKGGKPKSK